MIFLSFPFVLGLLASFGHAAPPLVPTLTSDLRPFNHGGLRASVDPRTRNNSVESRAVEGTTASESGLDETARRILSRAAPAAPHFVVYGDAYTPGVTGPPNTSSIKGFNVFALAFLLTEGAYDKAAEWTQLSSSQRSSIKSQYAAAGIKLIVSAFGSTDAPTSSGADPVSTANTMAKFVKQYNLDGIDVDYEDFDAFDSGEGSAERWLTTFTKQLRKQLPQGQYILTHAPVAPWFSPNIWSGGGYLQVHKNVGNLIDWYNVQFYNQGSSEYTNCNGLLQHSSSQWPESSIFEIAANGVDINKLVIGKPAKPNSASNGYISPSGLSTCVAQAHSQGWNAGVMVWEYPDAGASWIKTVRSKAFPV